MSDRSVNDVHTDEKSADLPAPRHQISMAPTYGSHQDPDERPIVGFKTWLVVAAASLAYFQQLYSLVATASVTRAAATSLGGSDISIFMNQSFNIVLAVLGPPLALGSDYIGRRWVLIGVYLILIAGALVSSESKSMQMMIAGRVLAGLSGSATGLTTAIPSEVLPHAWRPSAQAVFNIVGSFGGIFSALINGYLSGTDVLNGEGWRWSFRIECILVGFILLVLATCYNPPPRPVDPNLTLGDKLRKIDIVSTLLLACFLVPFVVALTYGGAIYPWSSAAVLAPLIISIAFFLALIGYSIVVKEGLVHHDLFRRSRNYALALVCQGFEGAIFLAFLSFYPPVCALVFGESGVVLGARIALPFVGGVISSPIVGYVATKTKDLRFFIVLGFAGYTVAMIGQACLPLPANAGVSWFWALLVGLSVGPLLINLVVIAQLAAPGHLIGLSSALLLSVRAVVGTIFVAIATAVVNAKIADRLAPATIGAMIQVGINPQSPAFPNLIAPVIGTASGHVTGALTGILIGGGVPPQNAASAVARIYAAVGNAYGESYRYAFIILAPPAFVATICAFAFRDASKTMNYLVDAPAQEIHHGHEHNKA